MVYEIVDLEGSHQRADFCCGRNEVIDQYCREQALEHHLYHATRAKVALQDGRVVGFYTLAATSLSKVPKLKNLLGGRNHICPAFHLQMVAICQNQERGKLGPALIDHAFRTAANAANSVGAMCIYIEAACERLIPYYETYGFARISSKRLAMYVPISFVRSAI